MLCRRFVVDIKELYYLRRLVRSSSSVHGAQEKFFDRKSRVFCKYDSFGGNEALAEAVANCLLSSMQVNGEDIACVHCWIERCHGHVISCLSSFIGGNNESKVSLSLIPNSSDEYLEACNRGIDNESVVSVNLDKFDLLFESANLDKFYQLSLIQQFKKMVYTAIAELRLQYPFLEVS